MIPGYSHTPGDDSAPVDLLFLNFSNWPGNPVYPYAFVQVSALARRAGLSVRRWDGLGLTREQQLACVRALLRRHRPRAVGFTIRQADSTEADEYLGAKAEAMTRWFPMEDTFAAIRQVRAVSDAKVVVGGFTFTASPVTMAEYLQPDFGVIGEPDAFIARFDDVMAGRLDGVANLLYRHAGRWRQNERVYYGPFDGLEYTPELLDEITRFHGERAFREAQLAPVPGLNTAANTGKAVAVEIARGCPYRCAFCCEPLVKGNKVRLRDLDVVEAEIRSLLDHGVRYLWFICSELNVSKSHVMALAERLIRINAGRALPVYWRAYFLPVKFSKDELRVLLRSGLMLEHNGPFSDLSNDTLEKLREPYRLRHALAHLRDLMELNEEPEFAHRKLDRWILWSWLVNPYSTLETVRQTIETIAHLSLDLHFDMAAGYPALRVYECLSGLPEDTHAKMTVVTGDPSVAPSVIHPSFYYSRALLDHFGGIDALHDFLYYAHATFLSKQHRAARDWSAWAARQDPDDLTRLLDAVTAEPVPSPAWVAHPDLGPYAPERWFEAAWGAWQEAGRDWRRFDAAVRRRPPAVANAIVASLLHQACERAPATHRAVFAAFDLLDAETGAPLCSPFKALGRLLPHHASEADLIEAARARCGPAAAMVLRYYVYALNLRLEPKLTFLIPSPPAAADDALYVLQSEVA
ncbi:MAG: hypothetical protein H6703_15665 [Myxococcales bacterium]|nr:hypothetical protein [Myxococcales bacterium]MCB9543864.1 hypothetical protein [Myxococcales bacterium]